MSYQLVKIIGALQKFLIFFTLLLLLSVPVNLESTDMDMKKLSSNEVANINSRYSVSVYKNLLTADIHQQLYFPDKTDYLILTRKTQKYLDGKLKNTKCQPLKIGIPEKYDGKEKKFIPFKHVWENSFDVDENESEIRLMDVKSEKQILISYFRNENCVRSHSFVSNITIFLAYEVNSNKTCSSQDEQKIFYENKTLCIDNIDDQDKRLLESLGVTFINDPQLPEEIIDSNSSWLIVVPILIGLIICLLVYYFCIRNKKYLEFLKRAKLSSKSDVEKGEEKCTNNLNEHDNVENISETDHFIKKKEENIPMKNLPEADSKTDSVDNVLKGVTHKSSSESRFIHGEAEQNFFDSVNYQAGSILLTAHHQSEVAASVKEGDPNNCPKSGELHSKNSGESGPLKAESWPFTPDYQKTSGGSNYGRPQTNSQCNHKHFSTCATQTNENFISVSALKDNFLKMDPNFCMTPKKVLDIVTSMVSEDSTSPKILSSVQTPIDENVKSDSNERSLRRESPLFTEMETNASVKKSKNFYSRDSKRVKLPDESEAKTKETNVEKTADNPIASIQAFEGQSIPSDSERAKLKHRCSLLNLQIVDNNGQGDCLFESISIQLSQSLSVSQLRCLTVDYIRNHKDELAGFAGRDWEDYLERLSKEKAWCDHLAITALAKALEIVVKIVSSCGPKYDVSIGEGVNEDVTIGHMMEFHYVALLPDRKIHKSENCQPQPEVTHKENGLYMVRVKGLQPKFKIFIGRCLEVISANESTFIFMKEEYTKDDNREFFTFPTLEDKRIVAVPDSWPLESGKEDKKERAEGFSFDCLELENGYNYFS